MRKAVSVGEILLKEEGNLLFKKAKNHFLCNKKEEFRGLKAIFFGKWFSLVCWLAPPDHHTTNEKWFIFFASKTNPFQPFHSNKNPVTSHLFIRNHFIILVLFRRKTRKEICSSKFTMDPIQTCSLGNQELKLKTWNKFARGFVSFHLLILFSSSSLTFHHHILWFPCRQNFGVIAWFCIFWWSSCSIWSSSCFYLMSYARASIVTRLSKRTTCPCLLTLNSKHSSQQFDTDVILFRD